MGLPGIVGQKGGENKRSGQAFASAGISARARTGRRRERAQGISLTPARLRSIAAAPSSNRPENAPESLAFNPGCARSAKPPCCTVMPASKAAGPPPGPLPAPFARETAHHVQLRTQAGFLAPGRGCIFFDL
ncbi:hypothetical protein [Methylobacter sp. BlB1]|uniref:hypothetical protein n=1 Tax=Methylobacter sp. BlB1 TaxID=2785914 RepID=UPI00189536AF|nr:hypothetical protein [Methylobacter sp. BlB1]MBF6649760.1 hypothetical protein [Methylobacter sp. BlB1]